MEHKNVAFLRLQQASKRFDSWRKLAIKIKLGMNNPAEILSGGVFYLKFCVSQLLTVPTRTIAAREGWIIDLDGDLNSVTAISFLIRSNVLT